MTLTKPWFLVIAIAGCCSAPTLASRLTSIPRGCTIAEVENALVLGRPLATLAPAFPDPMQWRRYKDPDGRIIDIAAAEDPEAPPGHDHADGRFYLWTGIWVTGPETGNELGTHRHRTHFLPSGLKPSRVPRAYRDYFESLDPSCPVTIAQIEGHLGLKEEAWHNLPATILPLRWFHYEEAGVFLGIGGVRLLAGCDRCDQEDGCAWREAKHAIAFSGYWRAGVVEPSE